MAKLHVYDDEDRAQIRARLKEYQVRYGIGVPSLYQRMSASLGQLDQQYIDSKSLQRFLNDSHRTSDEKVYRYVKFLEIEQIDEFQRKFVDLIGQQLGLTNPKKFDLFSSAERRGAQSSHERKLRPLVDYAGVYSVATFPAGELYVADSDHDLKMWHYRFAPTEDGLYLKADVLYFESLSQFGEGGVHAPGPEVTAMEHPGVSMLMPLGATELLMLRIHDFGTAFAILRDISGEENDAIVLEGASVSPGDLLHRDDDVVARLRFTWMTGLN